MHTSAIYGYIDPNTAYNGLRKKQIKEVTPEQHLELLKRADFQCASEYEVTLNGELGNDRTTIYLAKIVDEDEETAGHGMPTVELTGAKQKYHRRQRR